MSLSRTGKLLARAGLVMAGALAVVVLIALVAGDRIYPRLLEAAARHGTGLAVDIRGPVSFTLRPALTLTARDLDVAGVEDPDWDARADSLRMSLSVPSLLRGTLDVENIEVDGLHLRLRGSGLSAPADTDILGVLARMRLRVTGARIEIEDRAREARHTAEIDRYRSGPGPDGHPHIEASGTVDGSAFNLEGLFSAVAERAGDGMAFPLTASVSVPDWNLAGTMRGHVVHPLEGRGLDLQASLEIGDTAPLADLLGLPGLSAGKLGVRASIEGGPGKYAFEVERARLETAGQTHVEASGSLEFAALDDWRGARSLLQVKARTASLAALGRLVDAGLPELGAATLEARLVGPLGGPTLEDARLEVGAEGASRVLASGRLGPLRPGAGSEMLTGAEVDLRLDLHTDDPKVLPAELPHWLRTLDRLRVGAKATLKGGPGKYVIEVERARLETASQTRVEASGSLEFAALDDWRGATSLLQVKARTASLAALGRLLGAGLPALGAATLRARLVGPLGGPTLEDARLEVGSKGASRVLATGRLGPLGLGAGSKMLTGAEADLRLDLHTDDPKVLPADFPHWLTTLDPWAVRTRLRVAPKGWQLSELEVSAGREDAARITLSGAASGRGGVEAGVRALVEGSARSGDKADLALVLTTVDAAATARLIRRGLPGLGALEGRARIRREQSGELAMREISLKSRGDLRVHLAGDVGALDGLRDVELELTLAPTPPAVVEGLLDLALPLARSVALDGTLRRPGQESLSIGGVVSVGSSRLTLDLTAQHSGTVPLVKGRIHATSIHGEDFWGPTVQPVPAAPVAHASPSTAPAEPLSLLGLIPGVDFVLQDTVAKQPAADPAPASAPGVLPWSRLRQLDVDLVVHVDRVQGVHLSGGPLDLRLVDRAGRLEFGPVTLGYEGGAFSLHGVADSNQAPPSLEIKGHIKRFPIQELAAYGRMSSQGLAGDFNADYDLRSHGHRLSDLRASLQGDLRVVAENARLPLGGMDLLSASLLEWLTSWGGAGRDTAVPCAIVDLAVDEGIANVKTLYVRTDRSAAFGIGHLDLREDTMDLTITPKVEGLTLSPPTTVRVHGSISAPRTDVVNPGAVALHYGVEVLEAVGFSPAIFLRRLLSGGSSKATVPCK